MVTIQVQNLINFVAEVFAHFESSPTARQVGVSEISIQKAAA